MVVHVLNRANAPAPIFAKPADCAAFERALANSLVPTHLAAYSQFGWDRLRKGGHP